MNIFALKYWAEKVSLKKSGGQLDRLSSLLTKSTIDLNPYQIQAAIYAFNSPLSRGAILADEVGLGKTIEAGVVISQLWLEDKKRILLIVPASLRTQWRSELETHFGLQSIILDSDYFENEINEGKPVPMTYEGIFIASLPFVYKHIKLVNLQQWDLVVIDEAHRLRRVYRGKDASKMAFTLREAIEDKPKLLLTATPLQNNLLELYGLVSFIDNKLLGTQYHFKTRFIDKISQNPSLKSETIKILRNIIVGQYTDNFSPSGVITRTLRRQVKEYVKFPPRNSVTQDFTPTDKEQELYEKVSGYLQREDIASVESTQRNLMVLVYRKLLASSSFAIAPTLKKLYERLDEEIDIRKQEETPEPEETTESFENEEIEEANLEIIEEKIKKRRISIHFSTEKLKQESDELKKYYDLAISITHNTKGDAFINVIKKVFEIAKTKNWPEKVVVFTESVRTQKYLTNLLKYSDINPVVFSGSNLTKDSNEAYEKWCKDFPELAVQLSKEIAIRQALVYNFQNNPEKKVFLSTEAGAEGLNLQFCNLLINYDLPWNPQRIEQRIGRVHRYGQEYEVVIANLLNTRNYADKRVLELLTEKLNLFDGLFGSSDEILGSIESGIDFEKRILDIYQKCKTPKEIDEAFKQLQEGLKATINQDVQKIREAILDQFDPSISALFRKTRIYINIILSNYDKSLLNLCKIFYEGKLHDYGDGLVEIEDNNKKTQYLFRQEKEDEIGKISRVNIDHPIIKSLLTRASSITTNPIPTIKISIKDAGKLKERLKKGQEGLIYVFKLTVSAIEDDEILAPLTFMKSNEEYLPIDIETSKYIAESNSVMLENAQDKSPISEDCLYKYWNDWKKDLLKKFEVRNERLYTREMDRIHRYWDNYSLKIKDQMDKIKDEIREHKRKRDNTLDFQEKRDLDQKIQKAELRLSQLYNSLLKEEQEVLVMKQKETEALNEKLTLKIEEQLIAVTAFILYED